MLFYVKYLTAKKYLIPISRIVSFPNNELSSDNAISYWILVILIMPQIRTDPMLSLTGLDDAQCNVSTEMQNLSCSSHNIYYGKSYWNIDGLHNQTLYWQKWYQIIQFQEHSYYFRWTFMAFILSQPWRDTEWSLLMWHLGDANVT